MLAVVELSCACSGGVELCCVSTSRIVFELEFGFVCIYYYSIVLLSHVW